MNISKININPDDLICGVMTGTSLDGIDVAFCNFSLTEKLTVNLKHYSTLKYPDGFADFIKELLSNPNWRYISFLNFALSELYYRAITEVAKEADIDINKVKVIGIHGQTMWHEPQGLELFGIKVPSTLQIGNASVLAKKINIPVMSDFRSADIALGGQGAPLVPRFDYDYFSSSSEDRICLNVGGMANITYLPKNADIVQVKAFDTGAGNILIDLAMRQLYNLNYDKNGKIAASGNLIPELLSSLMDDNYVKLAPPKSTGREYYNSDYIREIIKSDYALADIITTLTHFTAKSIAVNIEQFCGNCDTLIAAGGGANNAFLMKLLQDYMPKSKITHSAEYGIPIDAKEAIAFAYLAYRSINDLPSNLRSVTGASAETVLGSLSM